MRSTPFDCIASSYAMASISAAEDRICMNAKQQIRLSVDEFLECDNTGKGCKGGDVVKVLNYGKRKGFVEESCYQKSGACPEDHFLTNECRENKNVFRVIDHCIAEGSEGVKREILKNGPVLAMLQVHTDLLTYSDGVYFRT